MARQKLDQIWSSHQELINMLIKSDLCIQYTHRLKIKSFTIKIKTVSIKALNKEIPLNKIFSCLKKVFEFIHLNNIRKVGFK